LIQRWITVALRSGGHFALDGSKVIHSSGDQVDRSGVPLKRANAAYGMAG
jgi:hypothetical protein